MAKYGVSLKYILGTGGSGESTFQSIWYGGGRKEHHHHSHEKDKGHVSDDVVDGHHHRVHLLRETILALLGVVILMAYIYPAVSDYDPYVNVMNAEMKHLTPAAAMAKYGVSLKYTE